VFFGERSIAKNNNTWGTQMPSRPLFFKSFYFRQVCDTINTGFVNKILESCCCGWMIPGLLWASYISSYLFTMLVQLGFATQSTVLSGESRSLLTDQREVSAFQLNLGSAVYTSISEFWTFFLFLKWRNDMVNFGDAKYTISLFALNLGDVIYSTMALGFTFSVVERDFSGLFFPICKVFTTCVTMITLWTHRPGKCGNKEKETLYFVNDWF
jgi:hypothetical protein